MASRNRNVAAFTSGGIAPYFGVLDEGFLLPVFTPDGDWATVTPSQVGATGTLQAIDTLLIAELTSIPEAITAVQTAGYYTVGDGGAAFYTRVDSQPSHAGKFQSADGQWWEIDELITTPLQFGAKGDGLFDDTVVIQNWINYLALFHVNGRAPQRTYKLTATINFPATHGYGILGDGIDKAVFMQAADNIPIFNFGATIVDEFYSITLRDITLTYANTQPATNTNAFCWYFNIDAYQWDCQNIKFLNGFYAIKVKAGIGAPWGHNWDNFIFGRNITGGCMDMTGTVFATPNNTWGRLYIDATNMTGAVFKEIKGYNWTIQAIEILNATNIPLVVFQAGSEVWIGALKLEIGTYNTNLSGFSSFNSMVSVPSSYVTIDQFSLAGTTCLLTSTTSTYVFGGAPSGLDVNHITVTPTSAPVNFYLSATTSFTRFGRIITRSAFSLPYANQGSSTSANFLTVGFIQNNNLSENKGDANYQVVAGDPCNIIFETALTDSRFVDLPVDTGNWFNGQTYKVMSKGAVNGANTIAIRASGNTKATLSSDNTSVTLTYRRNANPHVGWIVTDRGAL